MLNASHSRDLPETKSRICFLPCPSLPWASCETAFWVPQSPPATTSTSMLLLWWGGSRRSHQGQPPWAEFTVRSDSLPAPTAYSCSRVKKVGGGAAGRVASHWPGRHLLRLWTCRSPPGLPEREMVAGGLYPERSLVLSCLARIHPEGCPLAKEPSPKTGRQQERPHQTSSPTSGNPVSLLPSPFLPQQPGGA